MSNEKKNGTCGYNNFKRARYFHGQMLTDRDFREEQIYHNEKRKLLNRMLQGWGVVCGLEIKPTKPASSSIIVKPGMALDCNGNEILITEEQTIDISTAPVVCAEEKKMTDPCADYTATELNPSALYVVIRYREIPTDPVPVYAPGGGCEEKACDYARTREGFCIEVWDHPPVSPSIDTLESGEACTEPFPCPSIQCCPDPHYILLATISCGPRQDGIFGIKVTNENGKKIRFWAERNLNKVCLSGNNSIEVRDSYSFENTGNIDTNANSATWTFDWNQLDNLQLLETSPGNNQTSQHVDVLYHAIINTSVEATEGNIKVPVTLQLGDETWSLPTLESPVQIGISDVKPVKVITKALIRNVEYRKFVPTFQWFAWLSEILGEDYPWSGDVSKHCASRQVYDSSAQLSERIEETKKEIAKKMENMALQLEKKADEKKIEALHKKHITEQNKKIKVLEEKIKVLEEKIEKLG